MKLKGKIVQVSGPVVDVEFTDNNLPAIRDALYVMVGDEKRVMEVSQHIGEGVVRCILLAPSEGLCRDMDVIADCCCQRGRSFIPDCMTVPSGAKG